MKLPTVFTDRMNDFLKSSDIPSEGFFESFDKEPLKGIRINRIKVDSYDQVLDALGIDNDPVTWCDGGFYTTIESSGKDPYYHAGVYYPQEPSAMLPAQVLAALGGSVPQYSATMSTVLVVVGPIIIAYPFFQKYFVKGLTVGSGKG